MNIKINSIKNKLILYFFLFTILIFAILWIAQALFINSYYTKMLTDEIKDLATNIEKIQTTNLLDEISFKNSVNIVIFGDDKNIKYSSVNSEKPFYINIDKIIEKLNISNEYNTTFTVKLPEFNSEGIVYASYKNGNYYVITANVNPISSVIKVLSNQLIITTVIILIISVIISIYISKRLTSSIVDMTKSANKLAKGDYDTVFKLTEYEELNTLADTLNFSAKEFKKTDSLRKELIANVSHDIKTPLTIIRSYAEMIKDLSGENKIKREKDLDIIINQTQLLTTLVDDMMDLSMLESKTIKLKISKYNFVSSINKIVDSFKGIKDCNFKLKLYTDKNKINVLADEVKINQVINNLISNAINYVGKDETVYINIYEESDKIKVEVKDNGKGIEDTSDIFERYYKSNDKYRKSGYGTGLGLSIVKNILELHKFEYGVESKVGVGTSFYFYIDKYK